MGGLGLAAERGAEYDAWASVSNRPAPAAALVIFQPNLPDADRIALLEAYKATVVDGPNANGAYKLQVAVPLTRDHLQQHIESLKRETTYVRNAVAG